MVDGRPGSPRRRSWWEWMGLVPPAPDPGDWVAVIAVRINADTGASRTAARAVQLLTDARLENEQRPYTLPDKGGYQRLPGAIASPADRLRVAVLVRRGDLERAKEVLRPHVGLSDDPDPEPISDEELARLSREAGELTQE